MDAPNLCKGYLKRVPGGVVLITYDWLVMVFCPSCIVDMPSVHLYVRNIPLYGRMDRKSSYINFYSKA